VQEEGCASISGGCETWAGWELDRVKQPDTSRSRGFVFIGLGGRALKQHVVPCVSPIF